jgi:hypothetical protein
MVIHQILRFGTVSDPTLTVRIKGNVSVCVPNNISLMTPYILLEQEDWFEDEISFVRRVLDPGDRVIDIGANYGIYTLSAAAVVGAQGKVWHSSHAPKRLDSCGRAWAGMHLAMWKY